ncbi:hypothetical protein B0H16DRAFT_1895312 [Mycena metata]|uniref:F-box domain-containing protein n=1 Tax=Mycena metata TaxID=1033252 RepID=A0AAD7MN05_9AGAR|nr:hypothetical protein B0H16DRAFT_1895312 [Mycena metata]
MSNDALRAEVESLTSSISRQQLRLRVLQAQLDSIVYPVLTLPPEITSEIFLQCVPIEWERDGVNKREAPLLLTQICGDWRRTAVSTPALWTTFEVRYSTPGLVHLPEIAETWLSRACGCPLTVNIWGVFPAECKRTFETFQRHASTVEVLKLNVNSKALEAMETYPWDCPTLRSLSVSFISLEYPLVHPLEIIKNAPLLQEVFMTCTLPSSVTLPWRQLTRFTAAFNSLAECLEGLHLMPNLTYCALAQSSMPPPPFSSESPLSLPRVQHLVLFNYDTPPFGSNTILRFLILPALQNLEIRDFPFDEEHLDTFLVRSSPPLRHLSIQPPRGHFGGTSLRLSPSFTMLGLTSLNIWRPSASFAVAFFERLGGDLAFLPDLLHLSFHGCRDTSGETNETTLVEMAAPAVLIRGTGGQGHTQLQHF